MRKRLIVTLPPIAVEERPEKLSVSLPQSLKQSMESFAEYFTSASGATPTSFNAVIVGVLEGYLNDHGGYQRWLKSKDRTAAPDGGTPL